MPGNPLIAPILELIESDSYTDIALRPGAETRIKTPRGWLPISELAKGSRPQIVEREWLVRFVAQVSGDDRWLDKLRESKQSLAFMFPFDPKQLRLRCKVALCADPSGNQSDFTVHIRNLPMKVPAVAATGLPQSITNLLPQSGGLLIVSGTIGCGKTTTLASLINWINETRYANVITLEHLTEYVFTPHKSMITQRTVPDPVPSFLQGIQDALDGQAVDVLMIGEVVDKPTMDAMLRAAESGHLVLATMHARNAVGAISRIVDMFSGDEQRLRLGMLADKLIGVISQKLIPHRNGDRYALAYEILQNNRPAIADAIRTNSTADLQAQMQQGAEHGMVTMNQSLRKLVREQKIERQSALSFSYDKSELATLLSA